MFYPRGMDWCLRTRIGERMVERLNRNAGTAQSAAPAGSHRVDREIARALSSRVDENSRLAFAQSFALAIVKAWWRGRGLQVPFPPLPKTIERLGLSVEAAEAAEWFGVSLALLDPRAATYLVGTIYTTALPETYRGTHGIYYTPPELVERLLVMAEDAGVAWDTARVLDPAW
jgi:hypothetical protein